LTHRALLAGVLTGGALVILGGVEVHDRIAAGLGLLILAGALAGIRPLAGIRLWRVFRRRPPPE
jgi:hypothetical protein